MKIYVKSLTEYEPFKFSPEIAFGSGHDYRVYIGSTTVKAYAKLRAAMRRLSELPNTLFLHPDHRGQFANATGEEREQWGIMDYDTAYEHIQQYPNYGFLILYIELKWREGIKIAHVGTERLEYYDRVCRQSAIDEILKDLKKK